MTPIQALLFDFGGVLSRPQDETLKARMRQALAVSEDDFHQVYFQHRAAFDNGELPAAAYWQRIAADLGRPVTPEGIAQLVAWDIASWTQPNQPLIDYIATLASRGLKTGIISNMPGEFLTVIRRDCAWLGLFDVTVFSCDYGLSKPDPGLYQHCLQALGLPAQACVFTDDMAVNLAGATAIGLRVIPFENFEHYRSTVEPWLAPRSATPHSQSDDRH